MSTSTFRVSTVAKISRDLPDILHLEPRDRVAFADGDHRCDRLDLDCAALSRACGKEVVGLVVAGDLDVDGVVHDPSVDDGARLFVGKELRAAHLLLRASVVVVQEAMNITGSIIGRYNHGELTLGGPATVPLFCSVELGVRALDRVTSELVIAKPTLFRIADDVRARSRIDHFFRVGFDNDSSDRTALRRLHPELLDAICPDTDRMTEWVLAGRSLWAELSAAR